MKKFENVSYTELKDLYTSTQKEISQLMNDLIEHSNAFMCREPKAGHEKIWKDCELRADKAIKRIKDIEISMRELAEQEAPSDMQALYDADADINIYIADLGAYNNGELRGQWVSLPVDEEVLQMILDRYSNFGEGDFAIHDYECEFMNISEYSSISNLNEIAEQLSTMNEDEKTAIKVYMEDVDNDFERAVEKIQNGDYMVYSNCKDMEEVAMAICEESGMLRDVPENIARYFDFEAYGRDLDLEGNFVCHDGDYYNFY